MTIFFTVPPIGMINGIFLIGFYAPVVCSLYPDTRYTSPRHTELFVSISRLLRNITCGPSDGFTNVIPSSKASLTRSINNKARGIALVNFEHHILHTYTFDILDKKPRSRSVGKNKRFGIFFFSFGQIAFSMRAPQSHFRRK